MPVSQVARLSLDSEDSVLWRRNRVPTLTVRADVAGAEAPDVTLALQPTHRRSSPTSLPLGYGIDVGGALRVERQVAGLDLRGHAADDRRVLLLLMVQLQDMKKMALVLLTAPLGLIGVALMLAAFRIPFGFVAMLGVIALAGMIIRNSVILVVQIDQDVQARRAAVDGDRRVGGAPLAADRAHRAGGHPRDGAAHALGLLGPDGLGDHGRAVRRHAAHPALPARALCQLVWRQRPPAA